MFDGEGMEVAMPAELNHYPGPRHVLDLGGRLQLSGAQKKSVQDSFDRMHSEAIRLGRQLVDKERALDKAFVLGTVGMTPLKQLTEGIEELRGQLRDVHLAAHINVRSTLTREQIESYDRLRGYSGKE